MAHTVWSGNVTFGLVSVPIRLHTATGEQTINMHQYQAGTTDRIRLKKVNERTGDVVASSDISQGYNADGGPLVMLSDAELDSVLPAASRVVEVKTFVELSEIDPLLYNKTYNLAPNTGGERGYALIAAVLENTRRAAIVEFVMRKTQHLAAIRAQNGRLVMHTLFYADNVRSVDDIAVPDPVEPSGLEYQNAVMLVEAYAARWNPHDYRNAHADRLHELISKKRAELPAADHEEIDQDKEFRDLLAELDRAAA